MVRLLVLVAKPDQARSHNCAAQAAYGGIGSIVGVVSPLMWGTLYKYFSGTRRAQLSGVSGILVRSVMGPGGHMMIATLLMLISWWLLQAIPDDALFLGEDERGPAHIARKAATSEAGKKGTKHR